MLTGLNDRTWKLSIDGEHQAFVPIRSHCCVCDFESILEDIKTFSPLVLTVPRTDFVAPVIGHDISESVSILNPAVQHFLEAAPLAQLEFV